MPLDGDSLYGAQRPARPGPGRCCRGLARGLRAAVPQFDGASFRAHPGTCGSCSGEAKCEKSPQCWAGTCCSSGLCHGDGVQPPRRSKDGTHRGWRVENGAVLAVMGSACAGPPLCSAASHPRCSPLPRSPGSSFPGWGYHNVQGAWKVVPICTQRCSKAAQLSGVHRCFSGTSVQVFSIRPSHLQALPALPFFPPAAPT